MLALAAILYPGARTDHVGAVNVDEVMAAGVRGTGNPETLRPRPGKYAREHFQCGAQAAYRRRICGPGFPASGRGVHVTPLFGRSPHQSVDDVLVVHVETRVCQAW